LIVLSAHITLQLFMIEKAAKLFENGLRDRRVHTLRLIHGLGHMEVGRQRT
jgi:hypothetical protein